MILNNDQIGASFPRQSLWFYNLKIIKTIFINYNFEVKVKIIIKYINEMI